jgi:hypothetical protein
MAIKQFNAGWSKKEDRIFLNLNTSEGELFRFWITRFIAKHLLQGAQSLIQKDLEVKHNPRASQVIQEFQKDAIKKQLDFTEAFEGGEKKPLGADPVLVTGLDLSLKKNIVTVGLQLITNQTASFDLTPSQLQPLIILLEKLTKEADWKLESDDSQTIVSSYDNTDASEMTKKLH